MRSKRQDFSINMGPERYGSSRHHKLYKTSYLYRTLIKQWAEEEEISNSLYVEYGPRRLRDRIFNAMGGAFMTLTGSHKNPAETSTFVSVSWSQVKRRRSSASLGPK